MKWTDDAIAFFSGATTGGGYGLVLLTMEWSEMIIQGPLKLFFVIVISFCGGIAGLAGKDFYNDKIKKKWFNNEQNKD